MRGGAWVCATEKLRPKHSEIHTQVDALSAELLPAAGAPLRLHNKAAVRCAALPRLPPTPSHHHTLTLHYHDTVAGRSPHPTPVRRCFPRLLRPRLPGTRLPRTRRAPAHAVPRHETQFKSRRRAVQPPIDDTQVKAENRAYRAALRSDPTYVDEVDEE